MIVDASYIINASSLALVMRAFLSLGQHQDAYQTLKRHSTLARTMDHSQASDIITGAVQQLKTKASFHRSLVDIVLFCLQTMGKAADQDGHASEVVHVCLARSRTMLAFDVSPPHPHAAGCMSVCANSESACGSCNHPHHAFHGYGTSACVLIFNMPCVKVCKTTLSNSYNGK